MYIMYYKDGHMLLIYFHFGNYIIFYHTSNNVIPDVTTDRFVILNQ